ncbi:unnamed protein product [Linum tenue]|uniref:RNase H type-1 domain-containing protein n=1 Tax=Linum tenue TaxID=586396 RepID=A0AAV0KRF4_9ROSI|nr:unnamed protein product [Linum tenue]
MNLVKSLNGAHEVQTEVGVVCRKIRKLLLEAGGGDWKYANRKANEAAHVMAHTRTSWDETVIWFDRPPVFLINQLQLDDVTVSVD